MAEERNDGLTTQCGFTDTISFLYLPTHACVCVRKYSSLAYAHKPVYQILLFKFFTQAYSHRYLSLCARLDDSLIHEDLINPQQLTSDIRKQFRWRTRVWMTINNNACVYFYIM